MSNIADIRAFEVLDSRGNPTVQADVILDNGIVGHGHYIRMSVTRLGYSQGPCL